MLDANLPTYTHKPSADNPLNSLLYLTHNGSEPSPEYLLKRAAPSDARNQYALGLFDVHCTSVIYAEVLVEPERPRPTLSAAELRAQAGVSTPALLVPDAFDILLYNPDQRIVVKRNHGGWGKSESWDFEVPERSFQIPSASEMDRDSTLAVSELAPKVVFRWKRDGRLSRDMSCYMCGSSVGGKKSKEPDITVAMFRAARSGSIVTMYEPNMARVAVEDRKGLEVALILGAEVVRDLYLVPKHDPFNTGCAGGSGASSKPSGRTPTPPSSQQQSVPPNRPGPSASGALGLGVIRPGQGQGQGQGQGRGRGRGRGQGPGQGQGPGRAPHSATAAALLTQAQVDAETKRLQAMVAEENRLAREREQRDREEQDRIRKMLQQEEDMQRRRREAEVEQETERLRRQYGVQLSPPPPPQLPPRPNSAEPSSSSHSLGSAAAGAKKKHSNPLGALLGPYSAAPGASVSGFFHRLDEDKRRKKVEKKRSL
ncbi:hypothetical protein E4U21_001139 [Claviceps maximensis]|nr:hypothetical protein E4U21_001139 [Claviceps maximensis]